MGARLKVDLSELHRLFTEGWSQRKIGQLLGIAASSVATLERTMGLVRTPNGAGAKAAKKQFELKQVAKPVPPSPPPSERPLSPAMRHLAQFDRIIANVHRRQQNGEGPH